MFNFIRINGLFLILGDFKLNGSIKVNVLNVYRDIFYIYK